MIHQQVDASPSDWCTTFPSSPTRNAPASALPSSSASYTSTIHDLLACITATPVPAVPSSLRVRWCIIDTSIVICVRPPPPPAQHSRRHLAMLRPALCIIDASIVSAHLPSPLDNPAISCQCYSPPDRGYPTRPSILNNVLESPSSPRTHCRPASDLSFLRSNQISSGSPGAIERHRPHSQRSQAAPPFTNSSRRSSPVVHWCIIDVWEDQVPFPRHYRYPPSIDISLTYDSTTATSTVARCYRPAPAHQICQLLIAPFRLARLVVNVYLSHRHSLESPSNVSLNAFHGPAVPGRIADPCKVDIRVPAVITTRPRYQIPWALPPSFLRLAGMHT